MFYRILIYIIGFVLAVIGLTYIISYLNLLTIGYTFFEYLEYVFSKKYGLFFIIGLFLIIISIYFKRGIL